MKLAKRLNPLAFYGPCWCLTVFRWGRRKVELCYAPGWYETPEHVHRHSDGEFLILWARNRKIYRKTHVVHHAANMFGVMRPVKAHHEDLKWLCKHGENTVVCGPGDTYIANVPPWKLKTLSVRAGVPHGFKTSTSCMIWLCFEKWRPCVPVTSVADDLVLV